MLNQLVFSGQTINSDHIYGGVNYTCSINSETDLSPGVAASAQLTFVTDSLNANSVGQSFTYQKKFDSSDSWTTVGIFNITNIDKNSNGRFSVTAYDNVIKTEKYVDDLINSASYSTIGALFNGVCDYCSLTHDTTQTFTNANMPYNTDLQVTQVTARVILAYIAQAAGGFVYADTDGKIKVGSYGGTTYSTTISSDVYKKLEVADYVIPSIDSIWLGTNEDDEGYTYPETGTPTRQLRITYNPLFYFPSTLGDYKTYVAVLYTALHNSTSYRPFTMSLFQDYNIKPGCSITFSNRDSSSSYTSFVFNKSWTSDATTMSSTGNNTSDLPDKSYESSIQGLNGKYHTLKNDVDTLESEVGVIEGTVSSHSTLISQNATNISLEATARTDADTDLSGRIDVNANKVSIVVQGSGTTADPYKSNAAKIVADINETTGTSKVSIDADHIEMTGTTTFLTKSAADTYYDASGAAAGVKSGLATSGYTTINGGNITTGTINASTVNVTNINADNISVSGHSIGTSTASLNNIYTLKSYDGEEYVTNNCYIGNGDSGNLYIRTYESGSYTQSTRLSPSGVTYNGTTYRWDAIGSGSGATYPYISNASVSNGVLTLTKQTSSSASTTITYQALFG